MECNRLLYNRHPMITPNRLHKRLIFRKSWHADNSFFLDDPGAVDYMVIAGSPEWRIGTRMDDLFRFILEHSIPCAFLAVGAGSGGAFTIDDGKHMLLRKVLGSCCELLTVRDREAMKALSSHEPHLMPCTALYAARTHRKRTGSGEVGLVYQNCTQRFNSVNPAAHACLVTEYRRILEAVPDARVICHTNTDFLAARGEFPGARTFYSALSEDYEAIFDPCDFVVGPRVHGSGLAASLGIPNILVHHSARGLTGWGFRSLAAAPGDDLLEMMRGVDISQESQALIEWKTEWMEKNLELLRKRTSLLEQG